MPKHNRIRSTLTPAGMCHFLH